MKRSAWIFMLGTGVVASGVYYWMIERRSESDAGTRLASLETEIRRLEARTMAAENKARMRMMWDVEPAARAAGDVPGAAAAAQDKEAEPVDDMETDSPAPPPVLEERLGEAFALETPDSAWAGPASDRIVDVFSSALPPGSSIRDIECRASLCRIEITHAGEDAHAELVRALTENPDFWDGPGSIGPVTDASGETTTRAFFGRPGSDLIPGSAWIGTPQEE